MGGGSSSCQPPPFRPLRKPPPDIHTELMQRLNRWVCEPSRSAKTLEFCNDRFKAWKNARHDLLARQGIEGA